MRHYQRHSATAALIILATTLTACAGPGGMMDRRVSEDFAEADSNGNGVLSEAEFTASTFGERASDADTAFANLDTDRSAGISEAELKAGIEARRAR